MAKYDESYFKVDDQQELKIEDLVGEKEQILWQGKPNKKAFIFSQVFKMLPFALIWLLFDGTFIGILITQVRNIPTVALIFICVFFVFHLIPVWMWLYNIITANRRHKNLDYVFTDKRIIIKSGIMGIDVQNIYYSEIQSVNVKVNWVDKMLKVGDIYIKSTNVSQVLWDIPNPYVITNRLQKIALDIKTDIQYPNALRPDHNDGYNTSYTAKFDE